MRISVVDVGSNTVRLVVADAAGGVPLPVHTAKWRLRLSQQVSPGQAIPPDAVRSLVEAVGEAGETAARWGAADPLAFATTTFLAPLSDRPAAADWSRWRPAKSWETIR
ncbi:hypothetical protein ACWEGQ_35315, partial [Streptomyces seoulensis]